MRNANLAFHSLDKEAFRIPKDSIGYRFKVRPHQGKSTMEIHQELQSIDSIICIKRLSTLFLFEGRRELKNDTSKQGKLDMSRASAAVNRSVDMRRNEVDRNSLLFNVGGDNS